jgi:hypothetical protein
LLGWGLDAYVAYGTIHTPNSNSVNGNNNEEVFDNVGDANNNLQHFHYWVVTLDALYTNNSNDDNNDNHKNNNNSKNSNNKSYVIFWEPLTGQQFEIPVSCKNNFFTVKKLKNKTNFLFNNNDNNSNNKNNKEIEKVENKIKEKKHFFKHIFALFRHDKYFLNIQFHPNVNINYYYDDNDEDSPMASFDINNKKFWQSFENFNYALIKHPGFYFYFLFFFIFIFYFIFF